MIQRHWKEWTANSSFLTRAFGRVPLCGRHLKGEQSTMYPEGGEAHHCRYCYCTSNPNTWPLPTTPPEFSRGQLFLIHPSPSPGPNHLPKFTPCTFTPRAQGSPASSRTSAPDCLYVHRTLILSSKALEQTFLRQQFSSLLNLSPQKHLGLFNPMSSLHPIPHP